MKEFEKGMVCGIAWAVRYISEAFGEDESAINMAIESGECSKENMEIAGVDEEDMKYILDLLNDVDAPDPTIDFDQCPHCDNPKDIGVVRVWNETIESM